MGTERFARSLTKGDQNGIDAYPVLLRQFLPQGHLSLQRSCGLDIAPNIHDPMHMGVHAYGRFVKSHRNHKIGGFATYTGQGEQGIDILGNDAAELLIEHCGQLAEKFCLVAKKTDRMNQLLQLLDREQRQFVDRPGLGKKPTGCSGGHLVFGPC
jgi:hypothetical protein